eukprot:5890822-Ditylum_brightwellii.AAC.1
MVFGMQVQMQEQLMDSTQVLNILISVTERTVDNWDGHQKFGPGGNRSRFQHYGRGGNRSGHQMSGNQ